MIEGDFVKYAPNPGPISGLTPYPRGSLSSRGPLKNPSSASSLLYAPIGPKPFSPSPPQIVHSQTLTSAIDRRREMAQREKELQVPETLTLCVNNCGFYGNPATNNMCQICFQAAGFASPSPPSCSGHEKPSSAPVLSLDPATKAGRGTTEGPAAKADAAAAARVAPARRVNRCAGCRKTVGLTGFRCRCGELFCPEHRYSDRHDCSFDYKAAGREAIARENPVVRAAKVVKI